MQRWGLETANPKLLIVPWHLMAKEKTLRHIRRIAEEEATVVLETAFGMFDERSFINPVVPPFGLSEAFGYVKMESYGFGLGSPAHPLGVSPADRIYVDPILTFTPLPRSSLSGQADSPRV